MAGAGQRRLHRGAGREPAGVGNGHRWNRNNRYTEAGDLAAACAVNVTTKFGGDQPCYIPVLDTVKCPKREAFASEEAFFRTLFHEYSHASGSASRLHRDQSQGFGGQLYAAEELVAESGAAFVMADLGLPYTSQHAAYLKS